MKSATIRSVLLSASLLVLACWLGAHWGASAVGALNGLRSTGPFTHEEEAAFIRSRVSFLIVPPEWVPDIEKDGLAWPKYEMMARCGLTIVAAVATIAIGRFILRKNEKTEA